MKNLYFIIILTLIILNSCGEQRTQIDQLEKPRLEKWIEDITYFEQEFVNNSKPFPKDSIAPCLIRLKRLRANIIKLSDTQIMLELSRCAVMANNGHTGLSWGEMDAIPLRFYQFSDGMYIVKADSMLSEYLGAKVLKINSIEVSEVQKLVYPYISGIDRWKKYESSFRINSPKILHALGIGKKDSLTLTLIPLHGRDSVEVSFAVKEIENDKKGNDSWADLYPNNTKGNAWQYVKKSKENLPTYLKNTEDGVFYEFMDEEKIAYFGINRLWENCPDFKGEINEFLDILKTKANYNVVIDLRYFTGGNYIIPSKLATKPPKIIDEDKKIYLITSNKTFSAGLVTAARVKHFAKDKIVIVGEEVGDNLKFWAEGISHELPNSGIKIYDSKYEHDWKDDKFIPLKTFWVNAFFGVPAKDLKVDKEMQLSFDDYMKDKDPILDWIINEGKQ